MVDLTSSDLDELINAYTVKLPLTPIWLFDTSALRYMSGYVDDFSELVLRSSIITVAGGVKYPIDGVGLVTL